MFTELWRYYGRSETESASNNLDNIDEIFMERTGEINVIKKRMNAS